MIIPFKKFVGTGNDFVFLLEKDLPTDINRAQLAEFMCQRYFGVGADGLVIVSPSSTDKNFYLWDFYNSDGSKAEMCGNAARCATLFICSHFGGNSCEFETLAGVVAGLVGDDDVSVSWTLQSAVVKELEVDLENFKTFKGHFVNTGVPHFVLSSDRMDKVTKQDCLMIQAHPSFGPDQTNVTFLETTDEGINKTRTFERGVRDFTLACGTGVIASAFVLQGRKKKDLYELEAPGGKLKVRIEENRVTLIGSAIQVYEGQYKYKEVIHV